MSLVDGLIERIAKLEKDRAELLEMVKAYIRGAESMGLAMPAAKAIVARIEGEP